MRNGCAAANKNEGNLISSEQGQDVAEVRPHASAPRSGAASRLPKFDNVLHESLKLLEATVNAKLEILPQQRPVYPLLIRFDDRIAKISSGHLWLFLGIHGLPLQSSASAFDQAVVGILRAVQVEHARRQIAVAPFRGGMIEIFQGGRAEFVIVRIATLV